jgi:hypothetical protein
MATLKKDVSSVKKGMNRDTLGSELSKEEYAFALNANFHDEHGSGEWVLQNEPSNVKCSGFKQGYKVVGHKFDINSGEVYFMLTNPTTGFSEIGVISSLQEATPLTPTEQVVDGHVQVVLETPLENQVQIGSCVYTTLLSDLCDEGSLTGSKCLNFSIDDPIHENNIQIKYGKRGKTLWFTHLRNPQRYIELDYLDQYTQLQDNCTDETTDICLDCNKMRVFPLFDAPCLFPTSIVNGGSLRAGINELLIAYCDDAGNELSSYYSITNPVPIFDKNNNILDQTTLDYQTSQAIAVEAIGLDTTFEFYKIVVLHRNGLDGALSVYDYGKFPTTQTSFSIYSLQGKPQKDLADVLERRPFYDRAKGMAVANGYLYQYGLKIQRTINLQPVVNLMGAMARWASYQANEDLYEDGVAVANYASAMRDEVYPYGIMFRLAGGYETPLFPLIARPPKPEEIQELGTADFPANTETDSVLEYNPECFENNRKHRWQFENTASETDSCVIPFEGVGEVTTTQTQESACYATNEGGDLAVVDTIINSELIVDENIDLITYINMHRNEIINGTDPNGADIRDILEDPTDYPESCEALFDGNCGDNPAVLVSEEIFPIAVETQEITTVDKPVEDYTVSNPVSTPCTNYTRDNDGNLVEDTSFETTYMNSGEVVYSRQTPANTSCATATTPVSYSTPQIDNFNFLKYKGELTTFGTLQTNISSSATKSLIQIALRGTFGTASVNINGTLYTATFNTDLATTAANFVTTHAAAILADTGLVASSSSWFILLEGDYASFTTTSVTNLSGNLEGDYDNLHFTDKLHTNVIWYKISFDGADKKIFELGTSVCQNLDNVSDNHVRISAYDACSATTDEATYSRIINDISVQGDTNKLIILEAADFGGTSGTAYIAIDAPIRTREISTTVVNILTTPCGCFPVFQRVAETSLKISYTNLTFGKKQVYQKDCAYTTPVLNNCEAVPYKKGLFSYWESVEKYPCNKELYDSSELAIKPEDIAVDYRAEFENYYVVGGSASPTLDSNGNYVLVPETDFRDRGIRHYKYPDNKVSPFMSLKANDPGAFNKSIIFPIGFNLNTTVINNFLDVAVTNGLITEEERSRIISYEIYRGDRRIHRSVIAKGLLFDTYKYNEVNGDPTYYSNYPLNSLGADQLNNNVPHQFTSNKNNFFTFHSPETSFYKPTLTREMRIEGYLFGHSANYFDEVRDHPTYVILGSSGISLATTLGITEIAFEILLQSSDWAVLAATGGISSPAAAIIAAVSVAALVITATYKAGEYRYRWIQTFKNLGKPTNFAYYQASVGFYNTFLPNTQANQVLRGLTMSSYLKDGNWSLADEILGQNYNVNNIDREDSVAVHLGGYHLNYMPAYSTYDNVTLNPNTASRRTSPNTTGKTSKITARAASPYASMKQYLPAQYGNIESISWLNTGYCGSLSNIDDCSAAFGGDTYISRFALKRKFPFFRTNAFGLAPLTPYKYSDYFNVNPPVAPASPGNRYYIDYEINDDTFDFVSMFNFPGQDSKYNLDAGGSNISGMYVKTPNKFYLFSYGIPYFLVESEINCNFRYAKREAHENFYPNVNDVIEMTQEKNVSIRQPNTYFYNSVYSAAHSFYPATPLSSNYNREVWDKLNNLSNSVVYSSQDLSERSSYDPWLRYRPLDTYDFSSSAGDLVSMKGIESLQMLVRFTNGVTIFGAIDQMRDRLTEDTKNLGTGGIFAGRPININLSDLGHAGTQHNAMVSCEFGYFWVDAKRGKVFQMMPNAQGMDEISQAASTVNTSCEKWFKANLPFKILQHFPTMNVDNALNRVGITMGWDDRTKRVFITKKDYLVTDRELEFSTALGFYKGDPNCAPGFTYNPETNTCDRIEDGEIVASTPSDRILITLGDPDYFIDCSWTIAYNPLLKVWVSYYSFLPNYYLSYNDYFQTGYNTVLDPSEFGTWSHFPFLSSYQVFQGKLYPFIVEYPIASQMVNSQLTHIEYMLDIRKYYDKHNYTDVVANGFNKAVVYNTFQNTGLLNLVRQNDDDMYQMASYPKHNVDSVDILQTEMNGRWTFNYLYNAIAKERAGLPIWKEDCPQINKELDNRLLNYANTYKDYLRGTNFIVRLINDSESRFKMLLRWAVDNRKYYEQ